MIPIRISKRVRADIRGVYGLDSPEAPKQDADFYNRLASEIDRSILELVKSTLVKAMSPGEAPAEETSA